MNLRSVTDLSAVPVSGNFFWGRGVGGASFYLPSTFWQHYTTLMKSEYLSIVNI